jgi:hypothetical protein
MEYNGWTNYETWVVNLWMEDGGEHMFYEPEGMSKTELAEALKEYHEEEMPEVTGVFADLLRASLGEVNWHEIAGHLFDSYELRMAGERCERS